MKNLVICQADIRVLECIRILKLIAYVATSHLKQTCTICTQKILHHISHRYHCIEAQCIPFFLFTNLRFTKFRPPGETPYVSTSRPVDLPQDVRLDERVEQLFGIVNSLMAPDAAVGLRRKTQPWGWCTWILG